jgi:hypothetical protein
MRNDNPLSKSFQQGVIMQCFKCHTNRKASDDVSSQWTTVDLEGWRYFFCPLCWGNVPGKRYDPRKTADCLRLVASTHSEEK